MQQLTQEQAVSFDKNELWKDWTNEEIVRFQLFQKRLCMPFNKFHEAVEDVFKRPVFTHEFAYSDELKKEYLGEKEAPTFDEILNLIPAEKRILVIH